MNGPPPRLHTPPWYRADASAFNVALVYPMRGPAGIFGPACGACARLAAEEVNKAGGVLGRELRLVEVDGGAEPRRVAEEVEALVAAGVVQGVTGWHISSVRQAVAPRIAHRVPYVYTALYEGGERTEGVYMTSETPSWQLLPAMRLLAGARGIRRWFVVGNDYVWPRRTARAARRYARACRGRVGGEAYLPLGTEDFEGVLRRIERADADGVLMLLVGSDAVRFNRAFAAAGLDRRCLRLSTLMDENMLLGGGPEDTFDLYSAAGHFASLADRNTLDFLGQYTARFGLEAPVPGSFGESCYEGVLLLAALVERAGATDVAAIGAVAHTVTYEGPRGLLGLDGRHVRQRIYLARADAYDFTVLARLRAPHDLR
ncbi:substrate-binding domain-containing protein [Streptomyces scabiei]|uniref:substrate-binding domain-containing protein n=2 Tax=Streptomyces scabiei TaxID=1930 RepID=UPI0029A6E83A|nr:substrate-binding domain-containing protein [Streptomyces scabiei]MDX2535034.1 substrate-binding domain-containing protein [Streptomyces scabiei]MDX2796542.1 substrate-binding domain-containing protein [Streptomyces scabiei]MDX3279834.1 substrate-binding domain-containing protein [Streptomyces scabiei]MDX3825507.1 substrate-binding domain-containing protein [Streptomyces scabiei]